MNGTAELQETIIAGKVNQVLALCLHFYTIFLKFNEYTGNNSASFISNYNHI